MSYRNTGLGAVPPEALEEFLSAVRDGVPVTQACVFLDVTKSTVCRWLDAGEAAKGGIQRDFWERTTRAREEGIASLVADLRKHSRKDYRAAELMLRRRDPEHWADPDKRAELEQKRQRLEAELERERVDLEIARAKLDALKGLGKGGILLIGLRDLLDDPTVPVDLRTGLERWISERQVGSIEVRDLGAEPDDEE